MNVGQGVLSGRVHEGGRVKCPPRSPLLSPLRSPPSILPQTPSFSFNYLSFTPRPPCLTSTHPINQGVGFFKAADEGVNVCNNAIILCQKVGNVSLQNISNHPRGTEKSADGGNWGGKKEDGRKGITLTQRYLYIVHESY